MQPVGRPWLHSRAVGVRRSASGAPTSEGLKAYSTTARGAVDSRLSIFFTPPILFHATDRACGTKLRRPALSSTPKNAQGSLAMQPLRHEPTPMTMQQHGGRTRILAPTEESRPCDDVASPGDRKPATPAGVARTDPERG